MNKLLKILLPIIVIAGASAAAVVTVANRQQPERRPPAIAMTQVSVTPVERTGFTVKVKSRGTVRPRTESTVIPEVSGRVVKLSSNIREGEFFEENDLLLQIDPRDYEAEVAVAAANLAQARSALAEAQARADQARRDWKRLGEPGEPDDLVLRKPQMAGARAAVTSAQARLAQANLSLERTKILAPYAGRVLERNIDIGQFVSPGNILARIYAVDFVEIRLPLTNRQLEFVTIPEVYRDDTLGIRAPGTPVRLTAKIGSKIYAWQGHIVRAEGSIDTQSRQVFVIAQVDDPYGKDPSGRPPLKVGQFVEAEIEGMQLNDVVVIPRSALRAGGEVLVVNEQSRLESRRVDVLWSDEQNVVVGSGLDTGDRLVLTPLGTGMDGVEVKARNVTLDERSRDAESESPRSRESGRRASASEGTS
jgi:RND family efflux transporter MFP subunit